MRRKEKEITDFGKIEEIIRQATVCRLALAADHQPYIVPLNYGYKDGALYFHSAPVGKKIDYLKKNNRVCFEIDIENEYIPGETACRGTMKYRSIIGYGTARIIEDNNHKRHGLDILMKQHTGREKFEYEEKQLSKCVIIEITIDSMTGKESL